MRMAIDLCGGDKGPAVVIDGVQQAIRKGYIKRDDFSLFGTNEALEKHQRELKHFDTVTCSQKVEMHEKIQESLRKKDSTIYRGIHGLLTVNFDSFVSAGNTAAIVAISVHNLGRITRRPAIAIPLPNTEGPCLLLDAGANAHYKGEDMLEFATLGSIYAKQMWHIDQPSIGLLNIGSEPTKGNDELQLANTLLTNSGLNFIGNIEADKILTNPVNVVVCPGIIGNNLLKFGEGLVGLIDKKFWPIWQLLKYFSRFHQKSDAAAVGGAALLGVKGNVIIAHGKSDAKAIAAAIKTAVMEKENSVSGAIANHFKVMH